MTQEGVQNLHPSTLYAPVPRRCGRYNDSLRALQPRNYGLFASASARDVFLHQIVQIGSKAHVVLHSAGKLNSFSGRQATRA